MTDLTSKPHMALPVPERDRVAYDALHAKAAERGGSLYLMPQGRYLLRTRQMEGCFLDLPSVQRYFDELDA